MSNLPTRAMASDAHYSAVDHSGLEVVNQQQSGLEVVKDGTTAPEVVSGFYAPTDRKSSLNQPETLHPGPYDGYNAYDQGAAAPAYGADSKSGFPAYTCKDGATAESQPLDWPGLGPSISHGISRKRFCGMKKKVFVIVVIIGLIVILAAILGGVLGGVLGSHDSSSSSSSTSTPNVHGAARLNSSSSNAAPLQALTSSGLASMIDGDGSGRLVTYYQDPSGRIVENSYLNGEWTLGDQSQINNSVVTESALVGTSIAAVSYTLTGSTFRQIFFLSPQGYVQTTNSSTRSNGISTAWTAPVTISSDAAVAANIAMAACADTMPGGMTGIRMYYGSQNQTIQEVGYNFSRPLDSWIEWDQIQDSDPVSGVACTLHNTGLDRWISVYFRNSSTQLVGAQWWNYRYQNGWFPGQSSTVAIASGSDIAACNDGNSTDYVFFQIPDGAVTRAMVSSAPASAFLSYDNLESATTGSKLAAAYVDGGSLYMFQNSSSSSTMWAQDISRSGSVISDIAIS